MTEPTRDALHAETLQRLYEDSETHALVNQRRSRMYAHAAACVREVAQARLANQRAEFHHQNHLEAEKVIASLRAEVERLRAKAAIVDAMERGEIHVEHNAGRWQVWRGAGRFYAPTLLAAYAAATREGTD